MALPNTNDVREGVRATRLAAHIGDIAKYPQRRDREKTVALARRDTRWEDQFRHLLFPDKARSVRARRMPENSQTCTMCGDFCAMEKGMALFQPDISAAKTAPARG